MLPQVSVRPFVRPCTELREEFSSYFHGTSYDHGLLLREEPIKFRG